MSHRHSDSDKIKQITGIAAMAAGIGALVALLFAPKSGSDTRSKIREAAKNQKDALTNCKSVDLPENTDEAVEQAKDGAEQLKDKSEEIADKASKSATKTKSSIKEKLLDLKNEAKDIKDDLKK